jgi:hypothetical protein
MAETSHGCCESGCGVSLLLIANTAVPVETCFLPPNIVTGRGGVRGRPMPAEASQSLIDEGGKVDATHAGRQTGRDTYRRPATRLCHPVARVAVRLSRNHTGGDRVWWNRRCHRRAKISKETSSWVAGCRRTCTSRDLRTEKNEDRSRTTPPAEDHGTEYRSLVSGPVSAEGTITIASSTVLVLYRQFAYVDRPRSGSAPPFGVVTLR